MLFIPAISFALTPLPPLFGTTQTSDTPHLPHARATSGASEHAFVGEVAPPQAPSNSLVEFAMHLDSPRMARVGAGSHLGTPRDLVGGDGTVRWSAAYSAWGKVYEEFVADAQGPRGPPNAVQSPFRLLGQYYDEETGLSATRFRMWDAETGRWCSPDPLGIMGGFNAYSHDGAPSNATDALGLVGNPGTATHITYMAIDSQTGKPYIGYASMQGNQTPEDVLRYRYGGDFSRFSQQPTVVYSGYGTEGKATARGLEQRLFEQNGGLNGTANAQNPVGEGNPNREKYLANADAELKRRAEAAAAEKADAKRVSKAKQRCKKK